MKFLKMTATALALMLAVNLSARPIDERDGEKAKITVKALDGEKKAVIRVASLPGEALAVLKVKDQNGRVLYTENIRKNQAYAKRYDFSKLPAGKYAVEIKNGKEVSEQSFSLDSNQLMVKSGTEITAGYIKSVVDVEPNLVKVLVQNNKLANLTLRLYDVHGKILHEETVRPEETVIKGFDLTKVGTGRYSIAITGDGYQYVKNIENNK